MSKVEPSRVREDEHLIVEGMDISGHWNRMFEQRVLWSHDTGPLEKLSAIAGAESLAYCYQCGKCTSACPVDSVGDYSPRKIYRKVQTGIDLLTNPDLWLCTTCANCLRVCPKEVNMISIMPALREVAVAAGNVPPELQKAFENTFQHGNPMGEPARKRADWVADAGAPVTILPRERRPVDVLFNVECYWSYHPRGRDAARAFARVMAKLGIDWGILGPEEKCTCDSQRLAGEHGLFEMLAEQNIQTLAKYEFSRMVTSDPHAYNALRNEYPKLGAEYPIQHYTQFLAPLMSQLPWQRQLDYKVTFHDPCYLGRHNGEYDAPREMIRQIPGLTFIEMFRCKANGYCCGGGGGGMWLDSFTGDHVTERLSERRVREAVETGAEMLVVCCPYEVSRFEDAVKSTGNEGRLLVRDVIELVDEALR
ncbi:MAG TPA: (Fe-S)-binding protein [Candidatus Dormibacteraeota bacterium]|nr:(Fe-S)-binding protein [Candidatus Dormibacteraeota bacterium]